MGLIKKRIAILEDDPAQAELLKTWLKEVGYSYQLFVDGKSLFRALKTESFDLMILDWELPDTTGIEAVKYVRETIN